VTESEADSAEAGAATGSDIAPGRLVGCPQPPATSYDVALLDLDGVLYVGSDPVPTAAAALAAARKLGMRLGFVTNNASRAPEQVAQRLVTQGVPAAPSDVVTSAQAAARVLAQALAPGSPVLVVGSDALRREVTAIGLTVVDSADPPPAAVVQGYAVDTTYSMLAEAALAVGRGALWVGCNADATIPSRRGLLPGNGALLAVVATTTELQPTIAGKPEVALHAESVQRTGARRPLVVGDRLDTDIRGARRGGSASLLVLTGVAGFTGLLAAAPDDRPDLLAVDLTGLLEPHPEVLARRCDAGWQSTAGGWTATARDAELRLERAGDPAGPAIDVLRVAVVAAWAAADAGSPIRRVEPDPGAATALRELGQEQPAPGPDRR
jgi:glycerol-1-phosphatase